MYRVDIIKVKCGGHGFDIIKVELTLSESSISLILLESSMGFDIIRVKYGFDIIRVKYRV